MSTTAEITEFEELEATKVSGVTDPANTPPFLLLKAEAKSDDDDDEPETSFERQAGHKLSPKAKEAFARNRQKMKEGKLGKKITADELELDGKGDKDHDGDGLFDADGDGDGAVATLPASKADGEPTSREAEEQEEEMTKELEPGSYCGNSDCEVCVIKGDGSLRLRPGIKATLSAADRKKIPSGSFAYVDKKGGKHLPIHDEAHVRAAMGRLGQTDFSEADDPKKAKASAARKIVAAAKKHGIEVSDDSDAAEAAKGATQDALAGTRTPERTGYEGKMGQSGVVGPVVTGVKDPPANASFYPGGESTAEVPLEIRVVDNPPAPPTTDPALIAISQSAAKSLAAKSLATLWQQTERVAANDEAVKAGELLSMTGGEPGSMPWESYDAATLAQVAECLAGCCKALDCIRQREQIEAASGNPGDYKDAWDLEEAEQALNYALGVAARLSFHEQAEATKAGRELSGKNERALRAAHGAIGDILGRLPTKPADDADDSKKESDEIMTTLTKAELDEAIAGSVAAALKAERKKARKKAEKNANNGGDISESELHATSKHEANDPGSIPGGSNVEGQFVNKELADLQKQIAEQSDALAKSNDLLQRIASRPRAGGPSVNGQLPPGQTPPNSLASLEKALAEAPNQQMREQAGEALTRERLRLYNEARGIPGG